jgi:diguanylate cyclase (GGDEF)-like protein
VCTSSDKKAIESLTETLARLLPQLHAQWTSLATERANRIITTANDSDAFEPLAGLLIDLAKLIEQSSSPAQVRTAVEERLSDVLRYMRALEERFELHAADVGFCLNALRLALSATFNGIARTSSSDSRRDAVSNIRSEGVHRLDMLLGRLAAVVADASMHVHVSGHPKEQTLAFEYALLYERTRQLAITDSLTELYNFGYFWDRLKEERARAERYQRLLSLILVDIDHFKHYNDHNGHPAGNEILRRISRIMSEESREVDIVARYGGEELVILSPEMNRRHAFLLAERIRQRIADTLFSFRQSQPGGRITVSAGVATYPVDADTEESLVHCADQALYSAKGRGRNAVVAYAPEHKIMIRLRPYRPANSVALVGNFNAWDPKADHMLPLPDGTFHFEIALNPGTYHYKFVLDGQEWLADADCERQPDNYGGENNILRIRRE